MMCSDYARALCACLLVWLPACATAGGGYVDDEPMPDAEVVRPDGMAIVADATVVRPPDASVEVDAAALVDAALPVDARSRSIYGDIELGDPIDGPEREWVWVDVPGAFCADGSQSGFAFSRGDSNRLLIFMEQGVACFSLGSCIVVNHADGFGADEVAAAVAAFENGILSRGDIANPVRDWSYAFIPYCSGDAFAGSTDLGAGFVGRTQRGWLNMRAHLSRLIPTFADATQILLAGSGAGGFGAVLTYDLVQESFGRDVPVYVLSDSGPLFDREHGLPKCLEERWQASWNIYASMPPDCADCADAAGGGLSRLYRHLEAKYPRSRMGLIGRRGDSIGRWLFGFGDNDCAAMDGFAEAMPEESYSAGWDDLVARAAEDGPIRAFLAPGTDHILLSRPLAFTIVDEMPLALWLAVLLNGPTPPEHVGMVVSDLAP